MKKIIATFAVLAITVILGQGLLQDALAYRGDPNKIGPNCTKEQHDAIQNALESKNYAEWKKLMEGRPIVDKITEEDFAKFAQMHQLRVEGKFEEANKIRAELGLGLGQGQKNGPRDGSGFKRHFHR